MHFIPPSLRAHDSERGNLSFCITTVALLPSDDEGECVLPHDEGSREVQSRDDESKGKRSYDNEYI